jgi:predicted porin
MMGRNRFLILLAVGIIGMSPVGFSQTTLEIYGKLYPELASVNIGKATSPGLFVSPLSGLAFGIGSSLHYEVQESNSRIGVRGELQLGKEFAAFFQIEAKVPFDSLSNSSFTPRETFVGIRSRFGSMRLGNFETIYRQLGDTTGFFGIRSGNFVSNSSILSKPGFGSTASASFHLRRGNSIEYASPGISGFQFRIQYSLDELKFSSLNADLWSLGAIYERGPFYLAIAHEIHNDFFGGSKSIPSELSNLSDFDASSKDTATRLALAFAPGRTRIEIDYALVEYRETEGEIGKFRDYRRGSWSLAVDHRIGVWRFSAAYAGAGAGIARLVGGTMCSTDGLDGNQLSLGTALSFSQDIFVYGILARLNNGRSARYSNLDSSDLDLGADITQVALGVCYLF